MAWPERWILVWILYQHCGRIEITTMHAYMPTHISLTTARQVLSNFLHQNYKQPSVLTNTQSSWCILYLNVIKLECLSAYLRNLNVFSEIRAQVLLHTYQSNNDTLSGQRWLDSLCLRRGCNVWIFMSALATDWRAMIGWNTSYEMVWVVFSKKVMNNSCSGRDFPWMERAHAISK